MTFTEEEERRFKNSVSRTALKRPFRKHLYYRLALVRPNNRMAALRRPF